MKDLERSPRRNCFKTKTLGGLENCIKLISGFVRKDAKSAHAKILLRATRHRKWLLKRILTMMAIEEHPVCMWPSRLCYPISTLPSRFLELLFCRTCRFLVWKSTRPVGCFVPRQRNTSDWGISWWLLRSRFPEKKSLGQWGTYRADKG